MILVSCVFPVPRIMDLSHEQDVQQAESAAATGAADSEVIPKVKIHLVPRGDLLKTLRFTASFIQSGKITENVARIDPALLVRIRDETGSEVPVYNAFCRLFGESVQTWTDLRKTKIDDAVEPYAHQQSETLLLVLFGGTSLLNHSTLTYGQNSLELDPTAFLALYAAPLWRNHTGLVIEVKSGNGKRVKIDRGPALDRVLLENYKGVIELIDSYLNTMCRSFLEYLDENVSSHPENNFLKSLKEVADASFMSNTEGQPQHDQSPLRYSWSALIATTLKFLKISGEDVKFFSIQDHNEESGFLSCHAQQQKQDFDIKQNFNFSSLECYFIAAIYLATDMFASDETVRLSSVIHDAENRILSEIRKTVDVLKFRLDPTVIKQVMDNVNCGQEHLTPEQQRHTTEMALRRAQLEPAQDEQDSDLFERASSCNFSYNPSILNNNKKRKKNAHRDDLSTKRLRNGEEQSEAEESDPESISFRDDDNDSDYRQSADEDLSSSTQDEEDLEEAGDLHDEISSRSSTVVSGNAAFPEMNEHTDSEASAAVLNKDDTPKESRRTADGSQASTLEIPEDETLPNLNATPLSEDSASHVSSTLLKRRHPTIHNEKHGKRYVLKKHLTSVPQDDSQELTKVRGDLEKRIKDTARAECELQKKIDQRDLELEQADRDKKELQEQSKTLADTVEKLVEQLSKTELEKASYMTDAQRTLEAILQEKNAAVQMNVQLKEQHETTETNFQNRTMELEQQLQNKKQLSSDNYRWAAEKVGRLEQQLKAAHQEHLREMRTLKGAAENEIGELKSLLESEKLRRASAEAGSQELHRKIACLLYTSPSPRDKRQSRMPSSA